jgi:DNA-binding LacI/PurR family transcriptional regulator
VAVLSNAAIDREGIEAAIDHRSLKAQGLHRPLATYDSPHNTQDKQRVMDYRQELRDSGVYEYEQYHSHQAWQDNRRGIRSGSENRDHAAACAC